MNSTEVYPKSIDELTTLANWQRNDNRGALATVVRTWGSSPRPVGSHLAVHEDGSFVGSVSGGCIEGAVIGEALEVVEGGQPRLLEFGVSDDQAWEVGLSCGGTIHIYIETLTQQFLDRLLEDRENKRPVARVTRQQNGSQSLLYDKTLFGELVLDNQQLTEARSMLCTGRSGFLQNSTDGVFVRSYVPPARLIIVGAVHIAQMLAPMASLAGYEVTVVEPRSAFAQAELFPNVTLTSDWPDDALEQLQPDSQTAVVTLSHDTKIDDPALNIALKSPAFYIGSLGSTRTHAKRVERLTEAGFGDELRRINAPVGINLGGRAPAEIAVSILAQVIQSRYKTNKKGRDKS